MRRPTPAQALGLGLLTLFYPVTEYVVMKLLGMRPEYRPKKGAR